MKGKIVFILAFVLIALMTSSVMAATYDGLKSYFKMDNNQNMVDEVTGEPIWFSGLPRPIDGIIDNGVFFDYGDNNNFGEFPVSYSDSYSIRFWIKPTNGNIDRYITGYNDSKAWSVANLDWYISMNPAHPTLDGSIAITYGGTSSFSSMTIPNDSLPIDLWTMVSVTFNHTNYMVILYINGTEVNNVTLANYPNSQQDFITFGKSNLIEELPIDEFGFWNRVLSPAEIANLHASHSPDSDQQPPFNLTSLDTALLGFFKFEEALPPYINENQSNNNITVAGSKIYPTLVDGKVNNALWFDKNNDNSWATAEVNYSGSYSVDFWLNETATGVGYVAGYDAGEYPEAKNFDWYFAFNSGLAGSDGALYVYYNNSTSVGTISFPDGSIPFNQWLLITATVDASNNNVSIFVNNVLKNSVTIGGVPNSRQDYVSFAKTSAKEELIIDEFGLWDRVLTASDRAARYNSGNGITYSGTPSNQAPVVSVSSPANNTQTDVNEVVQFTVTDDNASTLSCSLYIDSSINLTNSSVLNNTLTSFNPTWAEGSHSFYVTCSDGELSGTSGTYFFYYDPDDPVIQSKLPLPSNTTSFTGYTMNIAGNTTNLNLSLVNITIYYPNNSVFYNNESTSFPDPTLLSWDWVFNTTTEPNGVWSMYIFAEDIASNSNDRYISFSVANCIPNWQCSNYAACNASDIAACNETTDLNTCGIPYTGDYSEFADQPCDYCSGDFVEDNRSACVDNIQVACYTDNNFATCCDITNDLVNDCLFGVVQSSGCQNESCGGYTADYDSDDIAPATFNLIGTFILIFAMFVPIIIISYLGYLGWKKLRLMKK